MIRRPRRHSEKHLDFIRGLPCVVCGTENMTQAAHVRFACEDVGKRYVGKGEKPDDLWTVPLCNTHHDEQHQIGEREFWTLWQIDPIRVALALWAHTGIHDVGAQIARRA